MISVLIDPIPVKAPESFQQGESNFEGTVSVVNIDVVDTLESKLKNSNNIIAGEISASEATRPLSIVKMGDNKMRLCVILYNSTSPASTPHLIRRPNARTPNTRPVTVHWLHRWLSQAAKNSHKCDSSFSSRVDSIHTLKEFLFLYSCVLVVVLVLVIYF